jgi:exonuclease SbcC
VPARRAELDERLSAARMAAARGADLGARAAQLDVHREAALTAERLVPLASDAEHAHLEARTAADAAGAAVTALLQRRLAGYAGELSAALVPGEPCAVCGAVEHPHPAAALGGGHR